MKTVHEVSELSGLSIRALHHYDAIGLLKPSRVTEAGYRLYDEKALERLQTVLLFRELGFKLNDIKKLLDDPRFDREGALSDHIEMLRLERKHIDGLIMAATKMLKGEEADLSVFDRREMEQYAKEAKERWGGTDAYREAEEKRKGRSGQEEKTTADGLMEKLAAFAALMPLGAGADEVQAAVRSLQGYITEHYYTCTDEILAGLGQMYTADERFRANIDAAGGEGNAAFVSEAIARYCGR